MFYIRFGPKADKVKLPNFKISIIAKYRLFAKNVGYQRQNLIIKAYFMIKRNQEI